MSNHLDEFSAEKPGKSCTIRFGEYGKCCTYTILCFIKAANQKVLRIGIDLSGHLNIIT